jgi:hypothetical protein
MVTQAMRMHVFRSKVTSGTVLSQLVDPPHYLLYTNVEHVTPEPLNDMQHLTKRIVYNCKERLQADVMQTELLHPTSLPSFNVGDTSLLRRRQIDSATGITLDTRTLNRLH